MIELRNRIGWRAAAVVGLARSTWMLDELRRIERNLERTKREREDAAATAPLVENEWPFAAVGGMALTADGAWVLRFSRVPSFC